MRNDFERAERRWQKKSLFRRHQQSSWLYSTGLFLLLMALLIIVILFMKPEFLKQSVQWLAQQW
jgi:type IV secretory pathway component VirB8